MLPFIDLKAQQASIRSEIDNAIAKVLEHGQYIMGPEVKNLEKALCHFTGSKHCISVSNGTDALVAALMALGVGPGDAIITTPFTFFASVEAILFVGATPVFVDIDPKTFNLNPNEVERSIQFVKNETKYNLKGMIPVDLFGLCADYNSLSEIAVQHGLYVLQDAAQSFGGETPDGRISPTHGNIGTTSFFPAKPLGCYGDGGACFTDDDSLAEALQSIRIHGKGKDKYDNVRVGQNCRMDTIQAAILLEKLKVYPKELCLRQRIADRYKEKLETVSNDNLVTPVIPSGNKSAWAQFTLRAQDRDGLKEALKKEGIPSVVYYPCPVHKLKACQGSGIVFSTFEAEKAANEVLSLPFYPYMQLDQVDRVVQIIESFYTEQ